MSKPRRAAKTPFNQYVGNAYGPSERPKAPHEIAGPSPELSSLDQIDFTAEEVVWQGKEFAFVANQMYSPEATDGNGAYGMDTRVGSGTIDRLMLQARPTKLRDQILRAFSWGDKDDLVQRLLDIKTEFTVAGFSLQCKPPLSAEVTEEEEEDDKHTKAVITLREKINYFVMKKNVSKVVYDWLRDYFTCDSAILFWRVDPATLGNAAGRASADSVPVSPSGELDVIPGLLDICTLNPGDIDYNNALGVESMKMKVPDALRKRIMAAVEHVSEEQKLLNLQDLVLSGIAPKWINAVLDKKSDGWVELRNDDGEFWIVSTKARKHYGLSTPSMFTVFLNLETRKSLSEGDFSTAFMMKHFIMLIQQGESIETGPLAGSRQNWLGGDDAKALLKLFTNVSKAMRLAVNHTLKVSFVFPPKEMFDGSKYSVCEGRIYNWGGITEAVMSGDGGTYSGGFIGIKKLVAAMCFARGIIGNVMANFFDHPSIRSRIGMPAGYTVIPQFDEQILKEPAQLLNEIRFLVQSGMEDPRTALRELGRNPETIRALKKIALKENIDGTWTSLKDWSAQMLAAIQAASQPVADGSGNAPGRPAKAGTTPNPESRQQSPHPSPQAS